MNGLEVLARIVEECFDAGDHDLGARGTRRSPPRRSKGGPSTTSSKGPDLRVELLQAVLACLEQQGLRNGWPPATRDRAQNAEIEARSDRNSRRPTPSATSSWPTSSTRCASLVSIRGYCDLSTAAAMGP
jgi:hypothetical protein